MANDVLALGVVADFDTTSVIIDNSHNAKRFRSTFCVPNAAVEPP